MLERQPKRTLHTSSERRLDPALWSDAAISPSSMVAMFILYENRAAFLRFSRSDRVDSITKPSAEPQFRPRDACLILHCHKYMLCPLPHRLRMTRRFKAIGFPEGGHDATKNSNYVI